MRFVFMFFCVVRGLPTARPLSRRPTVFFFIISGVGLSPLGTAATSGLLYKPQMIDEVDMKQLVERRLAGETEVLGENLPQRHFVHHKSHMTRPGLEPWPPRREASD
jgi:hypothetical protein